MSSKNKTATASFALVQGWYKSGPYQSKRQQKPKTELEKWLAKGKLKEQDSKEGYRGV